ncbi:MAG: DUF6285 domain-containing protein [Acidimicrobiales bacterium]
MGDVVAPELDGAAAFQLKVAGNALAIVERQLEAQPTSVLNDTLERALADAIRAGSDLEDEVLVEVRAAVVDRLRVANPRWLLPPDA